VSLPHLEKRKCHFRILKEESVTHTSADNEMSLLQEQKCSLCLRRMKQAEKKLIEINDEKKKTKGSIETEIHDTEKYCNLQDKCESHQPGSSSILVQRPVKNS
jgi:hypothetical protein